jgi:hypothetical protein
MTESIIQKAIRKSKEPYETFLELTSAQERTVQTQIQIANLKEILRSFDRLEQDLIAKINKEILLNKEDLCNTPCSECDLTRSILKKLIGDTS